MDISGIWGSFTVYPARFGVTRYRLVVFPPGISQPQRRALRLWRGWPLWGAALWVVLQIGGSMIGMPETALFGGTMFVIACGAMTFALAGDVRWQVRSLWATSMAGYGHHELDQRYRTLKAMAHALDLADLALDEGRISAAEHEARWWQVYDALDQRLSTPESTTLTGLCG
ncbi:hypothetical protein MANY_28420 [Mycolicibacterium anyangense]|uniref:Uncharacterized protein n=1 Tax=Mycolicibacterium anyangense TaxID=1431246 RepID=A0A6N4W9S2_9MYCO|nr:DUF6611 family protein [Mycolicibacterium anyangense]BBZ77505.1 hypothetical protein MANY_28420 [Mycolicibacterium anyangense]